MVNKVLLIGINYTGTSSQLSGCINDVKNMQKYLEEHYSIDEIKIMTDNCTDQLYPTRRNILKQLRWLSKDAQAGDNLFLHYSGHGGQTVDYDGSEEDGKDECIYPINGGKIIDDHLNRYLVNPLPDGVKLVCIIDACHSSTMLDLKYHYSGGQKRSLLNNMLGIWNKSKRNIKKACNKEYQESKATVITISGCEDHSVSSDAYINRQSQGAMTYSLLTCINANPKINYEDLINQMNILLKRKRYSQCPQLCYGKRMNLRSTVELL